MPENKEVVLKPDHLKILQGLFFWARLGSGLIFAGCILQLYNGAGLIITQRSSSGFFLVILGLGLAWLGFILIKLSGSLETLKQDSSVKQVNDFLWSLIDTVRLFFQSAVLLFIFWVTLVVLLTILGLIMLGFQAK